MPTPPASSHDGSPAAGSLPQHVPRLTVGIITPGAISTVLPMGAVDEMDEPAAEQQRDDDDHRSTSTSGNGLLVMVFSAIWNL